MGDEVAGVEPLLALGPQERGAQPRQGRRGPQRLVDHPGGVARDGQDVRVRREGAADAVRGHPAGLDLADRRRAPRRARRRARRRRAWSRRVSATSATRRRAGCSHGIGPTMARARVRDPRPDRPVCGLAPWSGRPGPRTSIRGPASSDIGSAGHDRSPGPATRADTAGRPTHQLPGGPVLRRFLGGAVDPRVRRDRPQPPPHRPARRRQGLRDRRGVVPGPPGRRPPGRTTASSSRSSASRARASRPS